MRDYRWNSSLVGNRKPDRRFYETIASRVAREIGPDVTPRFLMVGDHLANDVVTPLALGWSSILLDRHDANLCEVSIRSLSELPAWFAANSG